MPMTEPQARAVLSAFQSGRTLTQDVYSAGERLTFAWDAAAGCMACLTRSAYAPEAPPDRRVWSSEDFTAWLQRSWSVAEFDGWGLG